MRFLWTGARMTLTGMLLQLLGQRLSRSTLRLPIIREQFRLGDFDANALMEDQIYKRKFYEDYRKSRKA